MKRILLEDGINKHCVACKHYALAHRKGGATGAPCFLITFKMAQHDVCQALWTGSLKTHPEVETFAFVRLFTPENYPGIDELTAHPITPQIGQQLLDMGYGLIKTERKG